MGGGGEFSLTGGGDPNSLLILFMTHSLILIVDRDKPLNLVMDWGMSQGQGILITFFDNVLLKHGGLPHVLSLPLSEAKFSFPFLDLNLKDLGDLL